MVQRVLKKNKLNDFYQKNRKLGREKTGQLSEKNSISKSQFATFLEQGFENPMSLDEHRL